jgi:hypothetical protein
VGGGAKVDRGAGLSEAHPIPPLNMRQTPTITIPFQTLILPSLSYVFFKKDLILDSEFYPDDFTKSNEKEFTAFDCSPQALPRRHGIGMGLPPIDFHSLRQGRRGHLVCLIITDPDFPIDFIDHIHDPFHHAILRYEMLGLPDGPRNRKGNLPSHNNRLLQFPIGRRMEKVIQKRLEFSGQLSNVPLRFA